jgi:hypothetical protein
LDASTDKLLVITYNDNGKRLLVAHNFSNKPVNASVDLPKQYKNANQPFCRTAWCCNQRWKDQAGNGRAWVSMGTA